jgi:hypothetical protein
VIGCCVRAKPSVQKDDPLGRLNFGKSAVSLEIVLWFHRSCADAVPRLASFEAFAGLTPLVQGLGSVGVELDARGLGVGSAASGGLQISAMRS